MERKKRKYNRKCGICGETHDQEDMIRDYGSDTGWVCLDCYDAEYPDYDLDDM